MANIDVVAMLLSNTFTTESLDGVGAIKGVPCQIKSKTPIEGGTRITFRWESNSGKEYTTDLDVMNGKDGSDGEKGEDGEQGRDGRGIEHSYINSQGHMVIVYDDGEEEDLGEITVVESSGAIQEPITVSVNVGGYKSGNVIAEGTSFEQIFKDMLNPVAYPTLTNPSASLTATGAKLLEKGGTLNTTMTLAFNRGSINPAYGTSGYRAGQATSYTLDGTTQATNVFSVVITEAKTSYQGSVAYAEGEQPKDSTGKNYNSPLPAGSVNSSTINYEFVNALYANTANIASIAKQTLVSKSAKQKDFAFPAQTVANPEVFDVPSDWVVTAVQVKNDLSGAYEDALSQFTVTDVIHEDAGGNTVNYKRYTFNLGYDTGARSVRLKWS